MTPPELTTAWVLKTSKGRYLADRIHHMPTSQSLARAQLFETEERARTVGEKAGLAVQPILLAEIETE